MATAHKTLFAILFIGRQGSSYLEGLIDSHPDAFCGGELFSPTASWLGTLDKLRRGEVVPYVHTFGRTVGRYLDRRVAPRGRLAAGFKLPLLSIRQHPEIIDALAERGYRAIHLTRENLLDQYISMKLASINNAWRSDRGNIRIGRFAAHPEEVRRQLDQWTIENTELAAIAERLSAIHISYEELRFGNAIDRCLEFLNLPPRQLTSRYMKQRSGSQHDCIENFEDLRRYFAGSPWERHFEPTPP